MACDAAGAGDDHSSDHVQRWREGNAKGEAVSGCLELLRPLSKARTRSLGEMVGSWRTYLLEIVGEAVGRYQGISDRRR